MARKSSKKQQTSAAAKSRRGPDSKLTKAIIGGLRVMLDKGEISHIEIAERCGVFRQTSYDWILRGRTPTIGHLETLARIVGYQLMLVPSGRPRPTSAAKGAQQGAILQS